MLDDGRRIEVLAALGVDVYRLRAARGLAAAPVRLVVACAAGARRDARAARHLDALVTAIGADPAAVAWIEGAADGTFAALPEAGVYLMAGAEAARGASARLSIERQNSAAIAVCGEPAGCMRDGATKRALWQAVKPLARRLREG